MDPRTVEQRLTLPLIHQHNGTGIIAFATGVGKTKMTIDYINSELKIKTVLWTVPTRELRDSDVPIEFTKWGKRKIKLELTCYNSLSKYAGKHYDLVVLDEGHELTFAREENLNKIKRDRLLVLTATPPHEKEKKKIFYENLKLKIIREISIEESLEKGLISGFKIIIEKIKLDSSKTIPVKYQRKKIDPITKEMGYVENTFYTSEVEQYSYWDKQIKTLEDNGFSVSKNLRIGRMRSVYNLKSKLNYAKKIIQSYSKNKRVLVFGSTIDQVNKLCKHVYHSKSSNNDLNLFIEEKLNILGVVNALNQGKNVGTVDEILIVQLTSNPRQLIQRIGRGIRLKTGHTCTVRILIAEDTVDQEWLNKVLSHIHKSLWQN
jgi:superfamily II DNA or RNA helicase